MVYMCIYNIWRERETMWSFNSYKHSIIWLNIHVYSGIKIQVLDSTRQPKHGMSSLRLLLQLWTQSRHLLCCLRSSWNRAVGFTAINLPWLGMAEIQPIKIWWFWGCLKFEDGADGIGYKEEFKSGSGQTSSSWEWHLKSSRYYLQL